MLNLGAKSELSGISSFTAAAAEALIDLYQGRAGIASNGYVHHPVAAPQTLDQHYVLVEEIKDINHKLFRHIRVHMADLTCLNKVYHIEGPICQTVLLICWKKQLWTILT